MKLIEKKDGNKTIYKWVADDWEEQEKPERDLTTSGRKLLSTGLTKEQYEEIFHKKDNKINK